MKSMRNEARIHGHFFLKANGKRKETIIPGGIRMSTKSVLKGTAGNKKKALKIWK
jgi:hypothetical protein